MASPMSSSTGSVRVLIANAPCSYGAFEITVGFDPHVPTAAVVLDAVAAAGYAGIDLGPPGYLGEGAVLVERLAARGLGLAGGYLGLPFAEPDRLEAELPGLEWLLDTFDAVAAIQPNGFRPRPTLADAGSAERAALPGQAARDPAVGLDAAGWQRFADGVRRVLERCRARGYEPTFHHHAGTYVEAPWEIERLLDLTDVGLCLDTGHLLLGGGDPLAALRDWGQRINHLHLKDARRDTIAAIVEARAPVGEIWRRQAFCRLGTGDLEVEAVLGAIAELGYSGWLVVEQDTLPNPDHPRQPLEDQVANRAFLRALGL
jgi:inosose dehydratase